MPEQHRVAWFHGVSKRLEVGHDRRVVKGGGPELQLEVQALNSLPTAVGSEGAAAYRLDGRFTVKVGGTQANLLVPLYGVVAVIILAASLGGLAARYRKVSQS